LDDKKEARADGGRRFQGEGPATEKDIRGLLYSVSEFWQRSGGDQIEEDISRLISRVTNNITN